jgi:hypothetical protein
VTIINEEHAVFRGAAQHVEPPEQIELVAGDEGGALDQVGRPNWLRTEAQVGHGDRLALIEAVKRADDAEHWRYTRYDVQAPFRTLEDFFRRASVLPS